MTALNDNELYPLSKIKDAFMDCNGNMAKFLTQLRQMDWHPRDGEIVFNTLTGSYMPKSSVPQNEPFTRLTPEEGGYQDLVELIKQIGKGVHPFPDLICRDFMERFEDSFKDDDE